MAAVSLKQVAEKSGVSGATVSRVLNGKAQDRIPLHTRERVQTIARELGYSPNVLARNLARQRTDTIGLMLSDLRNPFFQAVLEHIERAVIEAGYQILLNANTSRYGQYRDLGRLPSWLVDGVLLWTIPYTDLHAFLGERARDMPVVYLGHLREDGSDAVAMDLYGAGKLATEHLIERGYRRPCFISTHPAEIFLRPINQIPGLLNNQVLGYQEVCRQAGREPEVVALGNPMIAPVNIAESSFRVGVELAGRPPTERPDAIICHNDIIALSVYNGLLQGGLRAPDDIGLIGFDGIEAGKYIPNGPLTTVRMPVEALARAAMNILIKRIGGDATNPGQQVLIPTELAVGGTT